MIPAIPTGHQLNVAAVISDPHEFQALSFVEENLPEPCHALLEIHLEPGFIITNELIVDLNVKLLDRGVHSWPEYPNQLVFAEDDVIYIAWVKGVAWMGIILGVIAVLPIIFLILLFTSETFRTILQLVVMMLLFWVMMKMMSGMMPALKPAEAKRELPPKKPLSERIADRIDGLAEGVGKITAAAERGETTAAGRVSGVLSGISSVVRAIRGAPEKAMSSSEKARLAEDTGRIASKLEEYEGLLTPEQKAKLAREREIMEELKYGYV